MQLSLHDFWISGMVLLGWSVATFPANSQIIPDQSLPMNSVVTKSGLTHTITGGTTRGVNLYHSFQEFSVPFNNTAYFNNASHVQNIVTRVTGNSTSNIDGAAPKIFERNIFLSFILNNIGTSVPTCDGIPGTNLKNNKYAKSLFLK